MAKTVLVVTSISEPNAVLRSLAAGGWERGIDFVVIGDAKSPADFDLAGCRYYGVAAQRSLGLSFAEACPTGHYSRKNIGYLLALREGADVIIETDDDNYPRPSFWAARQRTVRARPAARPGWINTYKYFTDQHIWPRGLPLTEVLVDVPPRGDPGDFDCPIQQGLADENPDVDAIYRLTLPLPRSFRDDDAIAVRPGGWCPFNSQNTTWFRVAAPLMYLPSFCSFRMTDIWRSFVAQRVAWECGWSILFHAPTVWQERNAHDIMKDFADEIPGYLHNAGLAATLSELDLAPGVESIPGNMMTCYRALVEREIFRADELPLLSKWLDDVKATCNAEE